MSFTGEIINKINNKLHSIKNIITCTPCMKRPGRTYEELQESVNILRESNVRLRRQILDKEDEIAQSKQANVSLKEDLEAKERILEENRRGFFEQVDSYKKEVNEKEVRIKKIEEHHTSLKREYEEKIIYFEGELQKNGALFTDNEYELEEMKLKLREDLHASHKKMIEKIVKDKDDQIKNLEKEKILLTEELQSLKSTLELREKEIKCLRLVVTEATQNEEMLNISMERIALLRAKCENLQDQIRKTSTKFKEDLEKEVFNIKKTLEENEQRTSQKNGFQCNSVSNSTPNAQVVTEIFENPEYISLASGCSPELEGLDDSLQKSQPQAKKTEK